MSHTDRIDTEPRIKRIKSKKRERLETKHILQKIEDGLLDSDDVYYDENENRWVKIDK